MSRIWAGITQGQKCCLLMNTSNTPCTVRPRATEPGLSMRRMRSFVGGEGYSTTHTVGRGPSKLSMSGQLVGRSSSGQSFLMTRSVSLPQRQTFSSAPPTHTPGHAHAHYGHPTMSNASMFEAYMPPDPYSAGAANAFNTVAQSGNAFTSAPMQQDAGNAFNAFATAYSSAPRSIGRSYSGGSNTSQQSQHSVHSSSSRDDAAIEGGPPMKQRNSGSSSGMALIGETKRF